MGVVDGRVVAGADGDELGSGGRRSGVRGNAGALCKRAGRSTGDALRGAASSVDTRPGPNEHRSVGGGERRRRWSSVISETATTACNRENGEGEEEQQLTAVAAGVEAGSGKAGAERGGEANLRRLRRGKATGVALRGPSGSLAR